MPTMITWVPILHFYQPPTQDPRITREVSTQNYVPFLEFLMNHPQIEITINFTGSLLEQLIESGDKIVIDLLKELINRKQIEFVSSPMYHPLLPLVSIETMRRQIGKSSQLIQHTFNVEPIPVLLPPELAITPEMIEHCKGLFTGIIIDESSVTTDWNYVTAPKHSCIFNENTKILPSARGITEILRSYPTIIDPEKFISLLINSSQNAQPIISVNDVELFGHHYDERLNLLETVFNDNRVSILKLSDALPTINCTTEQIKITPSSWSSSHTSEPFSLWANPNNDLQVQYHEFENYVRTLIEKTNLSEMSSQLYEYIAKQFDQGISSCHTYWLSNWPWWHPEIAEKGVQKLISAVRAIPSNDEDKPEAERMFSTLIHDLWVYHWNGNQYPRYKEYDEYRNAFLSKLPDLS